MAEEFDEVVREYQDRIFRLALSILENRADAEEAVQDALVRVWKGLPGFRADSALATWIYAITRNACLTKLGRRGPRTESLTEDLWRDEDAKRPARSVAACRDAGEMIDRLPAKYRSVVILFYMQEKSYEEVAKMLDLPVGTVKTYLHRARKQMAEEWARERVRKGGV